jgi:hypothetical protein
MAVVPGDLIKTLSRNVPPSRDVLKKGHDIVETLGAAERQHQEPVVGLSRIVKSRTAHTNLK